MMQAFRDLGMDCYLVDYNLNSIPGTKKIADTIDGIPKGESFDLIICSHVMEHVAQPLDVTKKLASHLSESGSIFIEVPMEVWKKPPLHREPVTHVNFFTRSSAQNLLVRAGLKSVVCELTPAPIVSTMIPVVKAIGVKSEIGENILIDPDGDQLLHPTAIQVFLFYFRILISAPGKFLRMLRIALLG